VGNLTGILSMVEIRDMSQNMIMRINESGSIDAKISQVRKPKDKNPGTVYINGIKYSTTSLEFQQIYPVV